MIYAWFDLILPFVKLIQLPCRYFTTFELKATHKNYYNYL